MDDDSIRPENPGDYMAEIMAGQLNELDRFTATRDLGHEMIQAGAEGELTPRLIAGEHRAEPEFTEADYAYYENLLSPKPRPPAEEPEQE
ncbi:MAG: hypothetical protein M3Z04_06430 [Chloroflexota bacterium]|nr:hypothetical protein [Chloroflexota bacterium]